MKTMRMDILEIAFVEHGPAGGWPVILSHGFPYDVRAYDEVAPILASSGAHVIVPYLRGFGPTRFLSGSAQPSRCSGEIRRGQQSRNSERQDDTVADRASAVASVPALTEDSQEGRRMRICGDGYASEHLAVSWRSGEAGGLGRGAQHAAEAGVAVAHRASVGRWSWHDGHCPGGAEEQADGTPLAGALPGARLRGAGARRHATGPQAAA